MFILFSVFCCCCCYYSSFPWTRTPNNFIRVRKILWEEIAYKRECEMNDVWTNSIFETEICGKPLINRSSFQFDVNKTNLVGQKCVNKCKAINKIEFGNWNLNNPSA